MSESHVVVRASAGAGKTYQLTNRFLALIMRGVEVDAILASTFSRKAAGEIIERVLVRLARAVLSDADARTLSSAIDVRATRQDFESKLAHVAARLHRLSIGTLDAFFMGLAQSFGAELGFVPGWRVLDEAIENTLRGRAVVAALDTIDHATLTALSRGEQKQSVVERLDQLYKDTFATYASSDAPAWLTAWPEQQSPSLDSAITALQSIIVLDAKLRDARDEDVRRARRGSAEEFLEKGLAKKLSEGGDSFYRKPIPVELLRGYADVFAAYAGPLRQSLHEQTHATFRVTRAIADALWKGKAELRGYGFDDVARMLAARMKEGGPSLDEVFFRLDQRVRYLMLDEFQDTSLAQWTVLRPLASEITSQRDGQHGFYCVGDVKQAIYGWRGGVRQIFDEITHELPGIASASLDKSYRSSPVIMDATNRIFGSLDTNASLSDYKTSDWSHGFSTHATAHVDLPGHVQLVAANDKDTLLDDAADLIARLHGEYPGHSIGVLVRRNDPVASLILLLSHRGVSASEEGGNPLVDTRVVRLLLSVLKVADHPGDTVSRFHVATSPLGPAIGLPAWRDTRAAEALSARLRERALAVGMGQLLRELVSLLQPAPAGRDAARLEQLVELGERFSKQVLSDAQQALRLQRFVEFVAQQKMEEPSAALVRVMTIHQAKGLEFDLVVATDLDERLFKPRTLLTERASPLEPPTRVSRDAGKLRVLVPELAAMAQQADQRDVDEALSSLYVTVTRARQTFIAVVAPSESSPATTLAGILRAGLAPGVSARAGETFFELGSAWSPRALTPPIVEPHVQPHVLLLPSPKRPQRKSPSGLEGGAVIDLREHLRLERKQPLARGSAIHAFFERIEWLEDFAAEGLPADLLSFISQPVVRRTLSRASWAQEGLRVYRELPFALREGGDLLSGKLDRVVVEGGTRVTVIDYKTDRLSRDDEVASRVAYYRPQIDAYRLAAARVFQVPLEHVSGQLLFLVPDRLESV